MKIFLTIIWVLTVLLSISTGIFKVLQQEADIELFERIGFSPFGTLLFGIIQVLGGLLLIIKKSRVIGAYLMILTFTIASIAVFLNNMYVFGFISLIFILMGYLVIYKERNYE